MDKELLFSTASKELQTKVEDTLKTIANCCVSDCDDEKVTRTQMYETIRNVYSYFSSEYQYINSRLNDISDAIYNHANNGHVPKLSGEAMKKFLDVLELNESYQLIKQPIYVSASDSRGQKTLTVE